MQMELHVKGQKMKKKKFYIFVRKYLCFSTKHALDQSRLSLSQVLDLCMLLIPMQNLGLTTAEREIAEDTKHSKNFKYSPLKYSIY